LAQNEELGCAGREAGSRRGLGQEEAAMSVAPPSGQNRIMIYGPKPPASLIAHAGKQIQNSPFSKSLWDKMAEINCSNPVTDELKKLRVNGDSLEFRFAAINWCFVEVHNGLDKLMDEALKNPRPSLDDLTQSKIKSQLEALLAMADEFRCYAQQRIDYYNSQKELAIVSPKNARTWLIDITRKEGSTSTTARRAEEHFKDAAGRCAPTLNPDFARAASTS
jgi:hypothetical protein